MRLIASLSILLLALGCNPAFADNLGKPMTFKFYRNNVFGPKIYADGALTVDSPRLFLQVLSENRITETTPGPDKPSILFKSEGGNLLAGLELGRIIRRYHLRTGVDAIDPISQRSRELLSRAGISVSDKGSFMLGYPSYCISACTLAFLGGVERSAGRDDVYAVHQFSVDCEHDKLPEVQTICKDGRQALSLAQQQSAEIARYLESMGIPTVFLSQMVLADPSHVNVLSESDMEKYGILTSSHEHEGKWGMEWSDSDSKFVLVYREYDSNYGTTAVSFACGEGRELMIILTFDHHSAQEFEFRGFGIAYRSSATDDQHWFALSRNEILRYPYLTANDCGVLSIRGTRRVVDALRKGTYILQIIGTYEPEYVQRALLGITRMHSYLLIQVDREKFDAYLASCH
jgi:hypothetical protein